ncbi:MAG: hypothetical protein R6X34_07345 [Chloroflexota bacterium]
MPSKKRLAFESTSLLLFIIVPLLSLAAIQPILTGILPWRGDGLLHLVRLAELERAVRAGVLFPRWSPDLGYGFGFPLFHYYAPFSYYVGLVPRLLGFSLPVSMAVSYVLALWALGWGAALWARDVWRNWLGVITAVLATLYAPYILYNLYHRAALAELWGLAWLALVLWGVNRLIEDQRLKIEDAASKPIFNPSTRSGQVLQSFGTLRTSSLIFITVFYALLILSHNITALIGTPFILGYALFLLFNHRPFFSSTVSGHVLLPFVFCLLALLFGLGLSAFFWLPAFFERNLVQIENLTATSAFAYVNHFLALADLLAWPQTADPQQVNPAIPRSLSWPVLVLALLAWLPTKRLKIEGVRMVKAQRLGLTLAALLCLLMASPLSQPLWAAVDLLAFVQFPWRLLGPASLFLAMLAGLGAMQLWARLHSQFTIHNSQFIIVIAAFILLFALPWLFPSRATALPIDLSPADTIQFEVETGWLGTTAAADYLPRSVEILPKPDMTRSGLAASQLPIEWVAADLQADFTGIQFSYASDESTTAVFHQFLFPGWQAKLDGQLLPLSPSKPEGLITAVLPPGEHTFSLTFASTPLRTTANIISGISFVLLLALIAYSVTRQPSPIHNSPFTIHNSQFILYPIAAVLILFILKTFILDHINSPFRTVQFDEQRLAATEAVNFGNVIKLLDADFAAGPLPADQELDITLIWQALPPVAEEYSVSVQMLGQNGRRVAQSDSFHPAGLPLPRWQAGEYGLDAHSLTVSPATPPGEYQLVAFVYNPADGRRLETLNEAGLPIGNEHHLGSITLTAPTQFPDPAGLTIAHTNTEGGGESPFLADNVQLLGYDAPLDSVAVGQTVPLTLYWHTPQTPTRDYTAEIWVSCEGGVTITEPAITEPVVTEPAVTEPVEVTAGSVTVSPNTAWRPGQVQRAEYDLTLRPVDQAGRPLPPGFCTLYLRLTAGEDSTGIALETFTVTAPERRYTLPETAVTLPAEVVTEPVEAVTEPVEVTLSLPYSAAPLITLAGYTLNQNSIAPGETLPLTLYWRPEAPIDKSYQVFVQLLDENGRLLTQQDQIPAHGSRPTTGWVPGEIITDDYALLIPADAANGRTQLITGFYDPATGQRLPLTAGSGDAITLPVSIEVKTAE